MAEPAFNCPHCGKQLKHPSASFCTNCGAPIKPETAQALATVHGGMLAKFIVQIPGEESREEFLAKVLTTVGRSKTNMIQVASPIVSGQHATIELTRKGHAITDLNSTNGTFVNGHRLKPGEAHMLASNDIVRFSDALGNSATLTYIAPSVFSEITNIESAKPFTLTEPTAYIGRSPETAFALNHPAVSWFHAKVIRRSPDSFTIQDMSSHNGTFLNGTQLRQRRETPLTRGDVIQIGPFNLVYQGQGAFVPFSAQRNFRLEAIQLEKTFVTARFPQRRTKTILKNLDLVINPREFVVVVGGSGSGKSTLLKALNGVSPATSGTVLVNGDNLYTNFNQYRTMLGYVPQDDIIHQELAVKAALRYAAQLRLPDASAAEIEQRIAGVLQKVGMTDHAGTLVRDLSGGQRKRVSIAVELLAEPWIFFLDEPTSGLDPGLEKLMMDTLRQLADEGRTIVLVTHATHNIMANCDHVVFTAPGGQLAFFGPPDQATAFFGVNDFADIYTRLAQTFAPTPETPIPANIQTEYQQAAQANPAAAIAAGPLWAEHYRQSTLHRTYISNRQSGELARPASPALSRAAVGFKGMLRQFGVLTKRYVDIIWHDRLSLAVLLAVMPVIGVLLLLISNGAALVGHSAAEIEAFLARDKVYTVANQAQILLFMLALSANLLGVFAASYEIIKEQAIYRRERMINLKIGPYFASKLMVLGGFTLLQCLLLLAVLGLKVTYPDKGVLIWAPLEYYFTLVFTALASVALGLFISALAASRNTVIYLVLVALFVQIVFSGAVFKLSPAAQPLSWLATTRWSLEALGASTHMDDLNNLGRMRLEQQVDIGHGRQKVVQDVPTIIDFYILYADNTAGLLSRWILLWAHTGLWSALAWWQLKRQDKI